MIDENAFGVLLAHYDLENIEYSLEPEPFVDYLRRFAALVDERLIQVPLATGLRSLELGHGRYFEFADGDQLVDPLLWVREARKAFILADLPNVCLLCEGGRWVDESASQTLPTGAKAVIYGPSEPLRKALAAEAHAQPTAASDAEQTGWGPGLYVEKDAIERLGKSLKNAPTALTVLSSVFYRIGA